MTAAEIAHALGGAKRNGRGWLARCCCHEDRQPSLSLHDGDRRLLVRCFAGCDARNVLDELRRRGLIEARRYSRSVRRDISANADLQEKKSNKTESGQKDKSANAAPDPMARVHRIWRDSADPRGTLAEKYLRGRGLALDDDLCGRVLRFHARCPFGPDRVPALIAAFRPFRNDDETRPPQAIHRIGLNPDGSKIDKMMLGPVGGCAVKLDPDQDVAQGLGICEGIETGLAIRATGWRPVWALGSAGAIKSFVPIPGIEALTIFADHDANGVGTAAATECARAWQAAGHEVLIRTPRSHGADWLDKVQS